MVAAWSRQSMLRDGGNSLVIESDSPNPMCAHCGSRESRRLGDCSVCHHTVCEKCGNVQIASGERKITHHECLKKADGHFRMIKFVQ